MRRNTHCKEALSAAIIHSMTTPVPETIEESLNKVIDHALQHGFANEFQRAKARRDAEKLANVDPLRSLVLSGFLYAIDRDAESAKASFRKAVVRFGESFYTLINFAAVLDYMMLPSEALSILSKAAKFTDGDPNACIGVFNEAIGVGAVSIAKQMKEKLTAMGVLAGQETKLLTLHALENCGVSEDLLQKAIATAYSVMSDRGYKAALLKQECLPENEVLYSVMVRGIDPMEAAECNWDIAKALAVEPSFKDIDLSPFSIICRPYDGDR